MNLKTYRFDDLKIKCFESVNFRGMIRQKPDLINTEIFQNLCTDTVIVEFSVPSFTLRGLKINTFFLHQRIGLELIDQVEVVFTLSQIKDNAAFFFGDL